jgi:hypothetical protein
VDRAFTICAAASNGIARVRPALTFAGAADATAGVLVHLERAVARLAALQPMLPTGLGSGATSACCVSR